MFERTLSPTEFDLPMVRSSDMMTDGHSPSEPAAENIQMALKCPVCRDYFQQPKQLNCGHSFCLQCLEGTQHLYSVSCPVCRKPTCFNLPGANGLRLLPNNYSLAQIVESILNVAAEDPEKQMHLISQQKLHQHTSNGKKIKQEEDVECDNCRKKVSMSKCWYCADCDHPLLCSSCAVERHVNRHRCVRVENVNQRWTVCQQRLDAVKTRLLPIQTLHRETTASLREFDRQSDRLAKSVDRLEHSRGGVEQLLSCASELGRLTKIDHKRLIELESTLRQLERCPEAFERRLQTLARSVDEMRQAAQFVADISQQLDWTNLAPQLESDDTTGLIIVWRPRNSSTPPPERVRLAATFTKWKPNINMLSYNGEFLTVVQLPPGRHEFKFIVDDDRWQISDRYETCNDGCGGLNNVVTF